MTADIAVIGLGVMGENLARNFHSRGWTVAVNNRSAEVLDGFMEQFGDEKFVRCADLEAVVAAFGEQPAVLVLMVTAGKAVDAVITGLLEHLRPGDVVVDGGNSHFPDTERRFTQLQDEGIHFVGMGVSGGEEGARLGPSMMPGGDEPAWNRIRPIVESAAAVSDSGPCVTWCGRGGAGHYTKMVHNGIEYGDMQLIAECWSLLRAGGHGPAQIRDIFEGWNAGRLSSFLIEITAGIVAAKDPEGRGALVDQILDVAGQKGTGRWTAIGAIEKGVPLGTVTAAVDARAMSSRRADRQLAAAAFGGVDAFDGVSVDDLEAALYASKIMSYTQGFDLLRTASKQSNYGINLAEVARIWTAGCIIRAQFLDRIREAYTRDPELALLCLDEAFVEDLRAAVPSWRKVVAAATLAGLPVPALSASLAWFDTMRTARGTACIIQAQRDWFGAHTFRRVGAPETPVHVQWDELEQL